ncbi:hypothetical protein KRM28CT15_27250 [Krasilnikovia sp. M28-CT-15]
MGWVALVRRGGFIDVYLQRIGDQEADEAVAKGWLAQTGSSGSSPCPPRTVRQRSRLSGADDRGRGAANLSEFRYRPGPLQSSAAL